VAICCGTVIAKEVRLWQSVDLTSDLDSSLMAVAHFTYAVPVFTRMPRVRGNDTWGRTRGV